MIERTNVVFVADGHKMNAHCSQADALLLVDESDAMSVPITGRNNDKAFH